MNSYLPVELPFLTKTPEGEGWQVRTTAVQPQVFRSRCPGCSFSACGVALSKAKFL